MDLDEIRRMLMSDDLSDTDRRMQDAYGGTREWREMQGEAILGTTRLYRHVLRWLAKARHRVWRGVGTWVGIPIHLDDRRPTPLRRPDAPAQWLVDFNRALQGLLLEDD